MNQYRCLFLCLFSLFAICGFPTSSPKLYVVAGQSNAVGVGDHTKSVDCSFMPCYEYDILRDSIIALKDPIGQNWKLLQQATTGSVAPSFAKRMSELTGDTIYIVSAGRGGASCHRAGWLPPYNTWDERGEIFEDATEKIDAALELSKASLSGILWLQGERDANAILDGRMSATDYKHALKNVITRFRQKYGKSTPFYIVQTGYQLDRSKNGTISVREMQYQVTLEMQYVYIVYSATDSLLERNWYHDRVHYNQEALNDIGCKTAEFISNLTSQVAPSPHTYHNRYGWELTLGDVGEFLLKNEKELNELVDIHSKSDITVPYYYSLKDSNALCSMTHKSIQVTYLKNENYELKLEVDLPQTGDSPFPFIFYIHGGGWSGGSLDVFKTHSSYLASQGIAGVRISYSLLGQGATLDQVQKEIVNAWDYLVANKDEFQLDCERWGILGASAGAYLGSMAALSLSDCKFFIGFYGTYDLLRTRSTNFPSKDLCKSYLGSSSEETLQRFSPISCISNRELPSFLLLHGMADTTIHYEQSQWFAQALRHNKADVEEVYFEDYEHAFTNRFFSDKYGTILLKIADYAKTKLSVD
ncbi:MAG: sialate O-acetylesterase [Phocaeicola sp.]